MITILKIAPGHKPERVTIPHTLEAMQEIVGGLIQAIYPYDDPVALVCNEEGKLLGLDLNRAVRDPATNEILDIIVKWFSTGWSVPMQAPPSARPTLPWAACSVPP